MKCSSCGNELNENDLFCGKCGNKIVKNPKKNNQKSDNVKKKKIIIFISIFICLIFAVVTSSFLKDKNTNSENIEIAEESVNIEKKSEEQEQILGYSFNGEISKNYAYSNDKELSPYTQLSAERINIEIDKEINDLQKVKELILEKYKNEKDIEFSGISYLYFNDKNKIYVVKLKKGDDYTILACYKNEDEFELKRLYNFYYAYTTITPYDISEDSEQFVYDTDMLFRKRSMSVLGAIVGQDAVFDFSKTLDEIFFKEDEIIIFNMLKKGCFLIRDVENQFLRDKEIYNPKSQEEISLEKENEIRKGLENMRVAIRCSEIYSQTAFEEGYDISDFEKKLSKLDNPIISFSFEVGYSDEIKSEYVIELRELNTNKTYDIKYNEKHSRSDVYYAYIYNVGLNKGTNDFELTISDKSGKIKKVIKKSIIL